MYWSTIYFTTSRKTKINKIATFFILIIGVSTIVSGLIPADINLIGHSILVWIGMLTVFPGLFIFAKNLKKQENGHISVY